MFVVNLTALSIETVASAPATLPENCFVVDSQSDLEQFSSPQLATIHNAIVGFLGDEAPAGIVKRFADREAAMRRTSALAALVPAAPVSLPGDRGGGSSSPTDAAKADALKAIEDAKGRVDVGPGVGAPHPAPKPEPAPVAPTKVERKSKGINLAPKSRVYAAREGSIQALLIDLLARPEGATFDQLRVSLHAHAAAKGTKPWKDVTIRSGLGWDVNAVKGYGVKSEGEGDARVYRLTYPAGVTAPVPHTGKAK